MSCARGKWRAGGCGRRAFPPPRPCGTRRLVEDDVQFRLRDMDQRGLAKRRLRTPQELTSRVGATEIPRILDRLEVRFDLDDDQKRREQRKKGQTAETPDPIDVLLAT